MSLSTGSTGGTGSGIGTSAVPGKVTVLAAGVLESAEEAAGAGLSARATVVLDVVFRLAVSLTAGCGLAGATTCCGGSCDEAAG